MSMSNIIKAHVELLDEGTGTLREVDLTPLDNGLYRLQKPLTYDAEDESWAFLPESIVALEEITLDDGTKGLLVRHPDPNAIRIHVEGTSESIFWIHRTNALHLGDGLYTILPTPHYRVDHHWKYAPGTMVRLKTMHFHGFSFLVPFEEVTI
ncbi:MAG: hypothetical protein V4735_01055 [Pseudomonadota bacterium]